MSSLTNEQKAELIDKWYRFQNVIEGEEKIKCHFATIFSDGLRIEIILFWKHNGFQVRALKMATK